MKKLFYLLIATIVLISCGNGSKNKTETSIAKENQTNRVDLPGNRSQYGSSFR